MGEFRVERTYGSASLASASSASCELINLCPKLAEVIARLKRNSLSCRLRILGLCIHAFTSLLSFKLSLHRHRNVYYSLKR